MQGVVYILIIADGNTSNMTGPTGTRQLKQFIIAKNKSTGTIKVYRRFISKHSANDLYIYEYVTRLSVRVQHLHCTIYSYN